MGIRLTSFSLGGRVVGLLCLIGSLLGCFEEPVREHVHLTLRGDGQVVISVVQEIVPPERAEDNTALAARVEDARQEIADGYDRWSRRLDRLDALADHESLERVERGARRKTQSALVDSFGELVPILAEDGLAGEAYLEEDQAELVLFPTGGRRATSRQREQVEDRLVKWSQRVAAYLEAAITLYSYLDDRPDRAVSCLAQVFDNESSEEGEGHGPLTEAEQVIVGALTEAMDDVSDALTVPGGEAYSLNELSRLVFDAFPVRLTVSVGGQVLEAESLEEGQGFLERRPVDVWHALMTLEGLWISPDIVTALVVPGSPDLQPDPDPRSFAAIPRAYSSAPSATEVEEAIRNQLVPAEVHRIRWRARDDEGQGMMLDPLETLAAAESMMPE